MESSLNGNKQQADRDAALAKRYQRLLARIRSAAERAGREPDYVRLIGACKSKPGRMVAQAVQLGLRDLGENYLSDAVDHQAAVTQPVSWHFIGPIQSNKTRDIAERFDWVHSLDREKIARRLHQQRPPSAPALRVLIQVNVSAEPSKSGVQPDQIAALAQTITDHYPRLQLKGLMAIPAPDDTAAFERMAELSTELQAVYPDATERSMGMSGDLEQAIACGATMIRIGTELFGPREHSSN